MGQKYDVGIVGVGLGANYGSVLTYFGLHETIKSFGYSALMVSKIGAQANDLELRDTHALRFANEHYVVSAVYDIETVQKLNSICRTFVIGSDQVWNYGISKNFGKAFYLDFVGDSKRKISYAASFGHKVDFAPDDEKMKISALMKRFNAISVREDSGVDICRDIYGVSATQVSEPIFLLSTDKYLSLAETSDREVSQPYLLAYVLDPTPEKKEVIQHIARKLGLRPRIILDGFPWLFDKNKVALNYDEAVEERVQTEDFLKLYMNSSFVITDSFHGTCFALRFNKPFAAIGNRGRGVARFDSLFRLVGHRDHFTLDPLSIISEDLRFLSKPDFRRINRKLEEHANMSKQWLKAALHMPVKETVTPIDLAPKVPEKKTPWDIQQCRILVSILKQQGIKHVVASSGTRNVTILRLIEANQDHFTVYPIADERSAAYFACGLATKLQEPIAICCTSGTAASNYLPGVTEAYYSHLPLVVITADRHPMYLNNHDDQTIPQAGMYKDVVKKAVSLPTGEHPNYEWYAGRLIKEAILESVHGVPGPVHINVPVLNIERSAPPVDKLELLTLRDTRRITRSDSVKRWQAYVDVLMKQSRIMILYGQNQPPTASQELAICDFAKKYNCVIVAEHISNLSGTHVVNPFNLLREVSQKDFNANLAPEILISVGGTQIMNHPVIGKLRGGPRSIRHWLVDPGGTYADKFFKLTSILECTQDWFFDFFSKAAGDIANDEEYFRAWVDMAKAHPQLTDGGNTYDQLNVEGRLLASLPRNSMLHLGVGNTFMMTQRFALDPSIEVQCNMGVNGIDGSASSFIGQVAASPDDQLCFLLIGDMSFFYDMNSVVNKNLTGNVRIMLINNGKAGLLVHLGVTSITQQFAATAEGWVKSLGFTYFCSKNRNEYDKNLERFVSSTIREPIFFEVFV